MMKLKEAKDFVEAIGRKIPLYPDMIGDLPPVAQSEFGHLISFAVLIGFRARPL